MQQKFLLECTHTIFFCCHHSMWKTNNRHYTDSHKIFNLDFVSDVPWRMTKVPYFAPPKLCPPPTNWRGFTSHWKKKWSHFDLKNWVTGRNKIRPGIPSIWRIYIWVKLARYWVSNWLDIESQIDSILRVLLTRYWESNWLDIESQIESIYWESI